MRVLVLSSHWQDPGPRERLRAIASAGYELVVITGGGDSGSDGPIQLRPVPVNGDPDHQDELEWHRPTLKRIVTEERPELIHIEALPESPLAAMAASLGVRLGIPVVLFSWRSLAPKLGLLERRRATRVLKAVAGVIGGNRLATALLQQAAPSALVATLPNAGVSLPPPRARQSRTGLIVGFAGRLSPERGADLLIHALGRTYGPWDLLIAGTGPEQEPLEALIQRLGLAARIRWLGGISREILDELWERADCLVVPSRETEDWTEAQAPHLVEAMSHGIAPVVTPVGILPELANGTGSVVRTVDDLTEALQSWVADPAACQAVGDRAREMIRERYLTSAVAERTLRFWQAVLERNAAATPSSG